MPSDIDTQMRDRPHPVQEDMLLQQRTWRIQRIGWISLGAVALAALLGLFGRGPLATTTATGAAGNLEVVHEIVMRRGGATQMRIAVRRAAAGETVLGLGPGLTEGLTLERTRPTPLREIYGDGQTEFVFASRRGEPLRIQFDLRPTRTGVIRGAVSLPQDPPAHLTLFSLP